MDSTAENPGPRPGRPARALELVPEGDGSWRAPLHGDRLPKGEHTFDVEVVDADGRLGRQHIEFMVDPTGRYTAVPCVRPRVIETAFC